MGGWFYDKTRLCTSPNMYNIILSVCAFVPVLFVDCFVFDKDNSVLFKGNEKDEYFGYSVFMRTGKSPSLYVGAPRAGSSGRLYQFDINSGTKTLYDLPRIEADDIMEDNLFGSTVDGGEGENDPTIVCAPKYTRNLTSSQTLRMYTSSGICFLLESIKSNRKIYTRVHEMNPLSVINKTTKYEYAFAELGHSLYYKNEENYIIGAPGRTSWGGTAFPTQVFRLPGQSRRRRSVSNFKFGLGNIDKIFHDYDLSGYSVAIANFKNPPNYVLGAPRGNDLKGEVHIFFDTKDEPIQLRDSDTIGSYYGGSLCVADVNGDGLDDLLVGAPTQSTENSYNSGYVYQYLNKGQGILVKEILHGIPSSPNAMFGFSMANIGKIGGSKYDAVAIGSPYENDGKGAVYIFIGSDQGLLFSQKIVMDNQKGFGFSLSKAADIDGNDIIDLAVGAYQSNEAVVLKSKSVFQYSFAVKTIDSIKIDELNQQPPFDFEFCISTGVDYAVNANITVRRDVRLKSNSAYQIGATIKRQFCSKETLTIQVKGEESSDPLLIEISVKEEVCATCPISTGINILKYVIPLRFDCGDDNVCQPDLDVSPSFSKSPFIFGAKEALKFQVKITNNNEPAYKCKLHLEYERRLASLIPKSKQDCQEEVCVLNYVIKKTETFELDVTLQDTAQSLISVDTWVECENYTSPKYTTRLQVNYVHEFDIIGSKEEKIYQNTSQLIKYEHIFSISNNGPSSARNYQITFEIPFKRDEDQLFRVYRPQTDLQEYSCKANEKFETDNIIVEDWNGEEIAAAQLFGSSGPKNVRCSENKVTCMEVVCTIDYIQVGSRKMVFQVEAFIGNIAKYFAGTFQVESTAEYEKNDKNIVTKSIVSFASIKSQAGLEWYWILLAVLAAIVCLAILIGGLWKCGFFKRKQYEQLQKEKLQDEQQKTFGNEIEMTDR